MPQAFGGGTSDQSFHLQSPTVEMVMPYCVPGTDPLQLHTAYVYEKYGANFPKMGLF